MERLASFLGLLTFIGLAWFLSQHRRLFPWRTVLWGLALQVVLALIVFKTRLGRVFFDAAQAAFLKLMDFSMEGAQMVFGPLASRESLEKSFGPEQAFILAITVSATIIVVSALSSLLYHWGILQRVVHAMAWVMQRTMKTSGTESLAAAANIFLGQTEAPLVIKPYLPSMTSSELMALMTGGMATIAGGVLAAYVSFGIDAGHLLTASVLSAPAGLMIAKIMMPETEIPPQAASTSTSLESPTTNAVDALCQGAGDGLKLALNVFAMLVAFVAVVALANFLFQGIQSAFGIGQPVRLEGVLGWANAPFAWLMGVPSQDCLAVGEMLGKRIVLNEFVSYLDLSRQAASLEPRSVVLTTFALCGFANLGSIAIQIGGIGSLAPARRGDLARLGVRSMVAGLLACYITACVAGLLL